MPLSRFNRDYRLTVTTQGRRVTVRPPFRVAFDGDKSIRGGLNQLTLQVTNLGEADRLALVKDAEDNIRIGVEFEVGYQGRLELLFKGTVHRGLNRRQGPDLVTELDCLDGGFAFLSSFASLSVTRREKALEELLAELPGITRGKITRRGPLIRPRVLVGNPYLLIQRQLDEGEQFYINDEQLFIIKDDEVTSSFIPVVRAETGLLGTPEREQKSMTCVTLMNPSVKIGALFQLISATAPHLDGVYKAETISYSGDYRGTEWQQTITGLPRPNFTVL